MRDNVYRLWQWLALPAAAWFATEATFHLAFGDLTSASRAAGFGIVAAASIFAARQRRTALQPLR